MHAARPGSRVLGPVMALLLYGSSAQAQPDAVVEFDLPAGPLNETLLSIGNLANVYMLFRPELVEPFVSPAIRGRHTGVQAAMLALQGSGLQVEVLPSGLFTIRPAPAASPAAAPPAPAAPAAAPPTPPQPQPVLYAVLPTVEVTGTRKLQDQGLRAIRAWSATRDDTPLAELPQAVSVLNADALDLQGAAGSADALGYVTGITEVLDIAATGGRFMPSHQVRGFSASYALSGVGTAREVFPVDTAFIERIEVPKGPSGVIAGFADLGTAGVSEFGGVINLVRKQAGPGQAVHLTQSASSLDGGTLRITGDVGSAWHDSAWWRLVAHASQSGRTDGGYERKHASGVLGTATWQRGSFAATATLQADGNRSTPAPASRGGLEVVDGGLAVVPPQAGVADPLDPRDRFLARGVDLDLDLSWRTAAGWELRWKTRAEELRNRWRRSEILFAPLETADTHRRGAMQWTLTGERTLGPARHRLTLGLDLQHARQQQLARSGANTFQASSNEQRRSLLLQDQISLGRWRMRLAVQRSDVQDANVTLNGQPVDVGTNRGVNGDAGVLFQWRPSVAFYAGMQSTIEAGQYLAEDFVLFDGSPRPPARMAQVQAGSRMQLLDGRLALTLEAFRIRKLDRVLAVAEGLTAVPGRYVNGLEVELAGQPAPGWDANLGFSYLRARDQNHVGDSVTDLQVFETRTAGIAERSLQMLARYRLPDRLLGPDTRLGIGLRAASGTLVGIADNQIPLGLRNADYALPGGGQLDLSLERLLGPWGIKVFVNNVTDQTLYIPTYEVTHLPMRPARHFGLNISYRE
jgi:iron complex outermembrane receptor protein